MNNARIISVRMPDELGLQIDAMARAEGVSVSEAMRAAAYRFVSPVAL